MPSRYDRRCQRITAQAGDPKPFCNNIQAFKPHAGNVIMTVESIDLEVTTDPKVGAGTVSVFQGTMNIRFKTADKDKKTTDIFKRHS